MTSPTELHWERAREIEPALLDAWTSLAQNTSPLADAAWLRCFTDAFGTAEWSPTLHMLRRGRELVAAIPMTRRDGLARVWTSFENEHYPYWLAAGELDDTSAELLLDSLDDGDYLFLRRLHVDGSTCRALLAAAQKKHFDVSLIQSDMGDARIAVTGSWDAFRLTLPKDYKDLPRKQRQLAKQGALELATFDASGPALDAALRECYELEQVGWKGTDGSPIGRDPRTLRFYTELAHTMAARQRFALYVLRLDGKAIAFQYTLRGGGHVELLKESYDPAFSAKSPGHLLRMMVLQQLFARGDVAYYHMGRTALVGNEQAWKFRWATEIAPLCTLRIYGRGLRARGAYLTGPVLRGRLKQARARFRQVRQRLKR